MLVSIEEHQRARIVEFVHLVEVGNGRDVDDVDDDVVFDAFGYAVERLVHFHALGIPVVPETDHDKPILFGEYRLIDLPAVFEMGEHVGHCETLGETENDESG